MRYDEPEAIRNILRHIRLMRRFFNDVVDEDPEKRAFLPEMHCAYMDMLNEEFAPHALDLALALAAWERRAVALATALQRLRTLRLKAPMKSASPAKRHAVTGQRARG